MTDRIRDELCMFIKVMGVECCIRAMDEAIEANAINWRYVRGTLSKKREQGVRCIADWNEREDEYYGTNKSGSGNTRGSENTGKKWDLKAIEL